MKMFRPRFVSLFACLGAASLSASPLAAAQQAQQAPQRVAAPQLSHVGKAVLAELEQRQKGQRGVAWGLTTDNVFDADWLVQTPRAFGKRYADLVQPATCSKGSDCNTDFGLKRCKTNVDCGKTGQCAVYRPTITRPGMAPERLCVGHSDSWVEKMYDLMVSGERFVDVTSLTRPDGRFYAAIRNAVTVLSHKPGAITVRALFASFPTIGAIDPEKIAKDFSSRLKKGTALRFHVAGFRSSNIPPSWNHSKIVAVDGRSAMSGGHNMWSKQYLGVNPVNDLSMTLHGGAARDSQQFVNALWSWTCKNHTWLKKKAGMSEIGSVIGGKRAERCPEAFDAARHAHGARPAGTPAAVFSLARLSYVDKKDRSNSSDHAFIAAIDAARKSIVSVQQDVGPVAIPLVHIPLGKWPADILNALGRALLRGVEVTLIVSNKNAKAGGLGATEASYSNGWSAAAVGKKLREHVGKLKGAPKGKALGELLCSKLTVASYRYSSETTYPKKEPIPNHAKTFAIDGQALYIGSQNFYTCDLSEHGFLVDDARLTREYLERYWNPLFAASRSTAVSGPTVARRSCQLD